MNRSMKLCRVHTMRSLPITATFQIRLKRVGKCPNSNKWFGAHQVWQRTAYMTARIFRRFFLLILSSSVSYHSLFCLSLLYFIVCFGIIQWKRSRKRHLTCNDGHSMLINQRYLRLFYFLFTLIFLKTTFLFYQWIYILNEIFYTQKLYLDEMMQLKTDDEYF